MRFRKPNLILSLLAMALIPLACTVFVGGPAYPKDSITVSNEAVNILDQQIQAAQTAAVENGTLSLSINETQITSLLAAKLSEQTDPLIQDPQVYLRDGEIRVFGKATQGNLQANIRIVLTASIDPEGQPVVTVSSADFGPFPAPQGLNDSISAVIAQGFTGSFGPAATGMRLESINIADGVMTLTGMIK